jgi:hypothetical protein
MSQIEAYLLFLALPLLVVVAAFAQPWIRHPAGRSKSPNLILNSTVLLGALAGVSFAHAREPDALAALLGSPWTAAIGSWLGLGLGRSLLRLQAIAPPWIPSQAARRRFA